VNLAPGPAGLIATRFPHDGAGILSSLTESDALAELPEDMINLAPGDAIACLPLHALYD
jgi:molybdopterin molybdotransferase